MKRVGGLKVCKRHFTCFVLPMLRKRKKTRRGILWRAIWIRQASKIWWRNKCCWRGASSLILSPGRVDRAAASLQDTQGGQGFTDFILPLSLYRYSEGTGSVIQEKGDREDVYTRAGQSPEERVSWWNHPWVLTLWPRCTSWASWVWDISQRKRFPGISVPGNLPAFQC